MTITHKKAAQILKTIYHGDNRLYKNPDNGQYHLVITKSDHTPEEFNRICNVISEYGTPVNTAYASLSYFAEHFKPIIATDAVQTLTVL